MIQDIDIDVTDWTMFNCVSLDEKIPKVPCVYILFNEDELVYVGNTKNLRTRLMYHNSYLNPNLYLGNKKITENLFNKAYYRIESNPIKRKEFEKKYYTAFEPKVNFYGLFSDYHYNFRGKMMNYRLAMGMEKRYEL